MAKFVEDPIVFLVCRGEPVPGTVVARGAMCAVMFREALISKAIDPVYRRLPSSPMTVRVRMWGAFTDGEFWMSAGYYEWTRWQWMALWWRAFRSGAMGRRIPRARTVRR